MKLLFRRFFAVALLMLVAFVAGCARGPTQTGVVHIIQIAPPNMLAQLKSGEIDGFVAWEPFNAEAVLKGNGNYLLRSEEIWKDHPCCVLAVSSSVQDRSIIDAILWAHIKATRFVQDTKNSQKVLQYAMEFTGKDQAVASEALKNTPFVEFPDELQFKKYYDRLKAAGLLKKSYSDIGYATEDGFFSDFLAKSYYQDMTKRLSEDPGWVPAAVPGSVTLRLGYISQDLHELPVYVAQREGYFQQVGLVPGRNLEIKPYQNGVAVMEGFKVKDIDASYLGGAPATLKRVNDDIKIRLIAGANKEGSAIVVRKDSGIKDIRDLAGKTVAVPGIGTVQHYLLEQAVSAAGLKLQLK